MNRAPIGIFDSGLGGLTVARAIYQCLPNESTVYFGDTARVPYGPKSPDTVRRYSREILHWLLDQGVKAVVIACNTSTAHALDELREESPVPVIGVIEPGAAAAAAVGGDAPIGVIGTAGTIASNAYVRAIHRFRPDARVVQQACPLFVPLVEEGWFEHPAAELIAREYLIPLRAAKVGALVLGCTHYPLRRPLLQRVLGEDGRLVIAMGLFALWYVPYFKRARARKAQRRAEIRAAAPAQPEPGSSVSKTVSSTETPGTSTRS